MTAEGASETLRIVGAIGGAGLRFTNRYEDGCPAGWATLWAMSDGTVRWRKPDEDAPMIVCDDSENCQPYGEHHQRLHGTPQKAEEDR